jgi:hypothetical protein
MKYDSVKVEYHCLLAVPKPGPSWRKAPDHRVQVVRTVNLSVFRGSSSATTRIVDEPMIRLIATMNS